MRSSCSARLACRACPCAAAERRGNLSSPSFADACVSSPSFADACVLATRGGGSTLQLSKACTGHQQQSRAAHSLAATHIAESLSQGRQRQRRHGVGAQVAEHVELGRVYRVAAAVADARVPRWCRPQWRRRAYGGAVWQGRCHQGLLKQPVFSSSRSSQAAARLPTRRP